MGEILSRRRVLASKIESVSGTAEALANADANFVIFDAKFNPSIEMFERRPNDASDSPRALIPTMRMGEITGRLEVKGSGTAGTPPAIGKFLKGCGMAETVVASTSVAYKPSSSVGVPTLTVATYQGGIRKQIFGARGTFRLIGKLGELLFLEITYRGKMSDEADIATLTGTGLETTLPVPFMALSTFQVHGFSPKLSSFSIDLGNQLTMRPDIADVSGYAGCLITGRNPRGTMDPEDELVAAHAYFTRWKNGTTGALNAVVGTVAGNIVTIGAPALQYVNQSEGDREGHATRSVDFALVRSVDAGDDELSLTFT